MTPFSTPPTISIMNIVLPRRVVLCTICAVIAFSLGEQAKVAIPPSIVENPEAFVPFKNGENVTLTCKATGDQQLIYAWYKSNSPIDLKADNRHFLQADGSLVIVNPDEATYQCFVSNNFGTAVSTKSYVRKAMLGTFQTANIIPLHQPLVGDYLHLQCSPPKCFPSGVVYWSESSPDFKLRSIDSSDRIALDFDGGLHFVYVEPEDQRSVNSSYFCVVYNTALRSLVQGDDQKVEPVLQEQTDLPYRKPKLVWSTPTHAVAVKGMPLKMKCIFSGYPAPTVSWSRVTEPLDDTRTYSVDDFGRELSISIVDHEDAGLYQCVATTTNPMDSVTVNFTVTVESMPFWRQNQAPQKLEVVEEENARFECHADGIPTPTITWSVNGHPVDALPADGRRTVGPDYLQYVNVTSTDTQVIQCNASNKHGFVFANAYLTVRADPPSFVEVMPLVMKVTNDERVILGCKASGAPKPILTWSKDSGHIETDGERVTILPNGYLQLLNVTSADNGRYECSAVNKFGNVAAQGELIVRDKTQIIDPPVSQSVVAGKEIILRCYVITDPAEESNLNVEWLKDGFPVELDQVAGEIGSYSISDSQVSASGHYTCRASNGLDSVERSADIIVKDRPEAPTDIKFTSCLSDKTEVSWTAGSDNNDEIEDFTVYYHSSLDLPGHLHEAAVVPASDSGTVSIPLLPWRNYSFYVVARNSIGTSNHSNVMAGLCSTPPSVPLRNPSSVCARQGSSTELIITWQAMSVSEMNGEGFHYVVQYRQVPAGNSEWLSEKIFDRMQTELIISDQETFKEFEVSVQAANDVGVSKSELEIVIAYSGQGTPQISPSNFRVVDSTLNDTSAEFVWDAVDEHHEDLRGFFRGYRIVYWKSGDRSATERIRDLIVRGKSLMCRSLDADYDSAAKGNADPNADNNIDDDDNDDEDDEDDELEMHPQQQRYRRAVKQVRLFVHDLWPYSKVSAGVMILNEVANGDLSEPFEFQTLEGVPGPVSSLSIIERGSHHIKLQWELPEFTNGIIVGYTVGYVNDDGEVKETAITGGSIQKTTLFDLMPSSHYNIYVCAMTSAGRGPKSSLDETTLMAAVPNKPVISADNIILGDTSANISWSSENGEFPPAEYVVEFRAEGNSEWTKQNPEPDINWVNITNLAVGVRYVVRVVAVSGDYRAESEEKKIDN